MSDIPEEVAEIISIYRNIEELDEFWWNDFWLGVMLGLLNL